MTKKSAFVLALAASLGLCAHAGDPVELLVTIDSGSPMSQGAALVLATQAQEQKSKVRVLLCDAGGDIALAGKPGTVLKPRNVTPQQMLKNLIKNGGQVEVCALYLPNTGYQASDLIDGVSPAKPADVAAFFLKPNVRILSF
ncbi:MAG: DsrE family protein [Burkholderiaceae bacterium]|nr:DsrE family protein [Burkholderiaceae bacterium]MDZ4146421.1 DsrE family protein [Burkholderiales bacterium]